VILNATQLIQELCTGLEAISKMNTGFHEVEMDNGQAKKAKLEYKIRYVHVLPDFLKTTKVYP